MNEKRRGLIALIAIVIIAALIVVLGTVTKTSQNNSNEPTTADDSELTNINFVDYDTFMSMVESGERQIFVLGQTTCGYCTMYKPVINEVSGSTGVGFNYININTLSEEEYNNIANSIDYLKENNDWGTPLTLLVEDGKVLNKINGYTDKDSVIEFLKDNGIIGE